MMPALLPRRLHLAAPAGDATQSFHFADAYWFRLPLRTVVIGLAVFALMWLYPAFDAKSIADQGRFAFALGTLVWFIGIASIFIVSMNDSHIEISDGAVEVTFESFFHVRIPLDAIASVELIDPPRRWRYRFGLSTNREDRISCSHGGPLIEMVLAQPLPTKMWPRQIAVRRFWLGVREHDAFLAALRGGLPRAAETELRAAA
jgi:hypothetical protein